MTASTQQATLLSASVSVSRQALKSSYTNTNWPSEILNLLFWGVVVIDLKEGVLFQNDAAEEVLSENDGLCRRGYQIQAARPAEQLRLEKLLRFAPSRAQADGLTIIGLVEVERPSGKPAYRVLIARLGLGTRGGGTVSMMFFIDPERSQKSLCTAARKLYHLTQAESRLTEKLLTGKPLDEIASQMNVSRNTAKTHLRSVLRKAEVKRQVDLLLLLASLPRLRQFM